MSPLLIVAAFLLFYVVLGCVMDELAMILLLLPIFCPTILGLDLSACRRRQGDLVRHPDADACRSA